MDMNETAMQHISSEAKTAPGGEQAARSGPRRPCRGRPRWQARVAVLALALLAALPWPAAPAAAANAISLENALAGDPSWQLTGPVAQNREIEGYPSRPSVNIGERLRFHISTTDPSFTLTIYRVGWYGGIGGRRMTQPVTVAGRRQPMPAPQSGTGLVDAGWASSYQLLIPSDWVSGVYLAKLVAQPSGRQRYIVFVVRNDARPATYLMQTSVTTYQAYNEWGGKSLYGYNSTDDLPATKVSFNRPYTDGSGAGQFFLWEIHMLRFLEREGYDVVYATSIDTDFDAGLLPRYKAFLSVGHDEYWSWKMRQNIEAARGRGVSLGFFGANIGYWQVRFEPSAVDGRPRRTMVCYKYTALQADPVIRDTDRGNDRLTTTQWRAWPLNRPEEALIGVMYHGDPYSGDIVIADAAHWVFAGTGLRNGDRLPGLLGYETDASFGFAPAGTQILALSPDPWGHSAMTLYTWPASGAVVFATGSMQFNWGLDDWWFRLSHPAAQQMTRNVLARLARAAP